MPWRQFGQMVPSGCTGAAIFHRRAGAARAGFTVSAVAVGGIAMLVLSCGDDGVGPPPPPSPPPAPVATTVTVDPGSASFTGLGETARFTAEVRDQNGQVMTGVAVGWTSDAAPVATVDAAGLVTAVGNGTATITAASGGVSGTATVTVAIMPLSRDLEIYMATEDDRHAVENPETLRMFPGHWLRATVRRPEALWHVSDTSVVQVRRGRAPDGSALRSEHDVSIEPLAPGEVTLAVSHDGRARFAKIIVGEAALLAERSMMDRPDDVQGPQIHAVYAVASDGPDENLDRHGRIAWSLSATVDWLYDKLGRRLRVDTHDGAVDVTFLRLSETSAEMEGRNVAALREAIQAQSWFSDEKTYAVYYRGPTDDAGGIKQGSFATVFSDTRRKDRDHYYVATEPGFLGALENTMAHELFHTMGVVHEECATNPAANGSSHVGDFDNDLMAVGRRRGRMITEIDIGRDDYWQHGISGCRDAADSPLWIPDG